jgi:hypothetical protein
MGSVNRYRGYRLGGWVVAPAAALAISVLMPGPAAAQTPPPAHGTIALEGTMEKFYRGANVIVVMTIDGVEHAYHFTKDLVVHGGGHPGIDALQDLKEGSTVVVHYTPQGKEASAREVDVIAPEGLETTEGTVTRVDRHRGQVQVRYGNGKTEVFQLTERAAAETARELDEAGQLGVKAVIYYSDEHGQKVGHFFKRLSN